MESAVRSMKTTGQDQHANKWKNTSGGSGVKVIRTNDVLVFDADRLYAGIVYHLRQKKHPYWQAIEAITPDSVMHLLYRLRREQPEVIVGRSQWAAWSDLDRLVFLMTATKTLLTKPLPGTHTVELTGLHERRTTAEAEGQASRPGQGQ